MARSDRHPHLTGPEHQLLKVVARDDHAAREFYSQSSAPEEGIRREMPLDLLFSETGNASDLIMAWLHDRQCDARPVIVELVKTYSQGVDDWTKDPHEEFQGGPGVQQRRVGGLWLSC